MKKITIDGTAIGEGEPCYIIAEVGLNHNGDCELARKLIDVTSLANANAVKFQKRSIKNILTKEMLDRPYVNEWSYGATYGEHREFLELSFEDYQELLEYAKSKKLTFMASAWDEKSVDFLEKLGISSYKVASADLTNTPLLKYIAEKEKPIILSTGMASLEEIDIAVEEIKKIHDKLILLQCTSTYPCHFEEINLKAMTLLKERYDTLVGYSGHERGIAVSEAAMTLGAVVIERHITLDHAMKGPDHAASLEPIGLTKLVRDIRGIEKAMGKKNKVIHESEKPVRKKLAKIIVARKTINQGDIIAEESLIMKSAGEGIAPYLAKEIIGKKAKVTIPEDTAIPAEALSW